MDYKEHAIKINPYIKHQILIAPFDAHISRSFDNQFQFQIIRIKSPRLKYEIRFFTWFINNIFLYFYIYKVIREIPNVGIIQAHEINPIVYSTIIGKILRIPVVGMIHGSSEAYSWFSGLEETLLAKLFKPTHALVVDSGTIAPKKFKKIWGDRVTIVNHGIDLDLFYPKEKNKSILRKLYLTESDLIILSISNLIPIKNIDLAIEVFEKIISDMPSSRIFLLIAGDGSQREELESLVKKKGLTNRVKFLGLIKNEEISDYISIADICIGLSLKDNMNRSILEPMACGKSIVVFTGGSIEQLITTGYNGFLVKRGDLLDFARKIKVLLNDTELRNEIGKHAREVIIRNRSWDVRINQDIGVYRKIMDTKRGGILKEESSKSS